MSSVFFPLVFGQKSCWQHKAWDLSQRCRPDWPQKDTEAIQREGAGKVFHEQKIQILCGSEKVCGNKNLQDVKTWGLSGLKDSEGFRGSVLAL